MVDAPHWSLDVVESAEAHGGIYHVLLTHQDDVADTQRYAEHFKAASGSARRTEHAAPFATDVLTSDRETDIAGGVTAVPMPGRPPGSVVYLVDERWLFTGDSFAWFRQEAGARRLPGSDLVLLAGAPRIIRHVALRASFRVGVPRPWDVARHHCIGDAAAP